MLFALTLTLLAIFIVWDYFVKKHCDEILAKSKITGPKAWPILGNALELRNINPENVSEFLKANTAKYGKIYRFWVFHQMHLRVTDPKFVEIILSSSQLIKKSSFYDFLVEWLGRGLLMSNGEKWHTRRKIITPAFHFKILEQFVEIFDQQSAIMVKKLQKQADGKTAIDMFPVVCLMTLDAISESAMGVKVFAQSNPDHEYVKALNYVSNVMSKRFVNPSQRTELLFRLTSPKIYKETQRCISIMHKFTTDVIEKRRDTLESSLQNKTDEKTLVDKEEYGYKQRMAFLDVLLQSTVNGAPLTNEDIREEVDTFMFEGHDTTTSAISFILYLIARHPQVQKQLVEEIQTVMGADKPNSMMTYKNLQDLKYMECVIKESLRLFPSVPAVGRELTEDLFLDEMTIPAKTNLILSFSLIMRNPQYFPDPDTFKPERFFGGNEGGNQMNTFIYTPFSAGPRNCIGQRYAMLEMKSTVSKMLRHFELLPLGPDVQPMTNIVMRSKTGANIGLLPRNVQC